MPTPPPSHGGNPPYPEAVLGSISSPRTGQTPPATENLASLGPLFLGSLPLLEPIPRSHRYNTETRTQISSTRSAFLSINDPYNPLASLKSVDWGDPYGKRYCDTDGINYVSRSGIAI